MASIFTKIVNGEIPSYKVAENDRFYAFLDINPMAKGHTLVIPKQEIDYLFALPPEELGDLMKFAQCVATALEQSVPCQRIGVAVLGMEVPHAHIHLIPLNSEADMDFRKPKLSFPPEEMTALAASIRKHFPSNRHA
jgi:histidine triad (HIT) family protein